MNVRTSIIIVVHDQEKELEENLPKFLESAEQNDAEVIVVDDMSADFTADVLKRMRSENERLYSTFLPKSVVVNPSRQRLAMAVGMKAAKGEYILLADIQRPPTSVEWLSELPIQPLESKEAEGILIYSRRKENTPARHQVWESLQSMKPLILKAERRSGRGHRARFLKFARGAYDAVTVSRSQMYDVVTFFDQPVKGFRLWGIRLKVYFKNLFNRA